MQACVCIPAWEKPEGESTVRGWTRVSPMSKHQSRWTPTLIMTFLLAVWFGIIVVAYGGPVWQVFGELIFLVPFAFVLRSMWAGVYADKERLRVRLVRHTRTVPLTEVSSITSVPRHGDPQDPMRSDILCIVLRDGETIRTSVRIRNPGESDKLSGPVYDRDEYLRIKDHLSALVHNRMLDEAVPRPEQAG